MHPSPFLLDLQDAAGRVSTLPLQPGRSIIGRGADTQICLDDPMVSRQHAELELDAAQRRLRIRDLGSRNGTLVNGEIVKERWLTDADRIAIGPFQLVVRHPHPDSAAPQAPFITSTGTRVLLADDAGHVSTLRDHDSPRIDAAHLNTLMTFGQSLLAEPDPTARFAKLCDLVVGQQFHARWAAVIRLNPARGDDTPQILCDATAALKPGGRGAPPEPYLSRSALRRVRETGEPVLAANVRGPANQNAPVNVEVSIAPAVTAMAAVACPISNSPEALDLLYVMFPPSYGTAEWLALVSLAVKQLQQADSTWADRRRAEAAAVIERELQRARQIQLRLVPRALQFPGLDLAIGFEPCSQVGGDCVDVLSLADGRILLTIADVCGKGMGAALVASGVHTMVRAGVMSGLAPAAVVANLNRHLCDTLPIETFVTMVAVAFNPADGSVEVINAGHPPPLLFGPDRAHPLTHPESNLPLGIEESEMVTSRWQLHPGESVVLFTDGLSEMTDSAEQELGIDGLLTTLRQITAESANPTAQTLSQSLLSHLKHRLNGRPPTDDQTFLLARRI